MSYTFEITNAATCTAVFQAAGIALALYIAYNIVLIVYRLSPLHPLAAYPGPKKARATTLYMAYYDIWTGGTLTRYLEQLHKTYGPVVRYGPNKLHFSEVSAFHTIYSTSANCAKDPWQYAGFDQPRSSFAECDPQIAEARRKVLHPFFSRRNIMALQHVIRDSLEKLCEKITSYAVEERPLDLGSAARALTTDVIMDFCFGYSLNALDSKGFRHPVLKSLEAFIPMASVMKHFPIVRQAVGIVMPWFWLANLVPDESRGIFMLYDVMFKHLSSIVKHPQKWLDKAPHPIIYHRLMDPNIKGQIDKRPNMEYLFDEAKTQYGAGSDTVGNTLAVGSFYIIKHPKVYKNLVRELKDAWPNKDDPIPQYEELEKLPYLSAVIRECLRVCHGVVAPLQRVVLNKEGLVIDGCRVPQGVSVSCAHPLVHHNPDLFPDPLTFDPKRWLGPDAKELESKGLVAFSRGPRLCLGVNLAWCELYMAFATLHRRFEFEAISTWKDIEYTEHQVPYMKSDFVRTHVKLRKD